MEYLKSVGDYKIYKPGEHDTLAAIKVSRWTNQAADSMLAKSPSEILDMFKKGDSVLIKNKQGALSAHGAATATYNDGAIEIGSIYTDLGQRSQGLGTLVTEAVLALQHNKNPDSTLFALGNEMSGRMFRKMGAEEMKTTELSDEVWEFCKGCERLPEQTGDTFMCCDTPYNLTKVATGL